MRKQDLKVGALLAKRRSTYGSLEMVRLLDTTVWRKTTGGHRDPNTFTVAPGHRCGPGGGFYVTSTTGYPVLERIYSQSTRLTPEQHAAAYEFIKTTELTPADILDADGHVRDGVLPEGVTLAVVDSRHLIGGWATVKREKDAQEKADRENREALKRLEDDRQARFGVVRQIALKILGERGPFGAPLMNDHGTVTMSLEDFEAIMSRVQ